MASDYEAILRSYQKQTGCDRAEAVSTLAATGATKAVAEYSVNVAAPKAITTEPILWVHANVISVYLVHATATDGTPLRFSVTFEDGRYKRTSMLLG